MVAGKWAHRDLAQLGQGCPQPCASGSLNWPGLVLTPPHPSSQSWGHCPGMASAKYTSAPLGCHPETPQGWVLTTGG